MPASIPSQNAQIASEVEDIEQEMADRRQELAEDITTNRSTVEETGAAKTVWTEIGSPYVDLRLAPYNVVAGEESEATANGTSIRQAITDYNGLNARLVLPMGNVYVNRDLSGVGSHRFAAIFAVEVTDIVLAGWGPGVTKLVMTGSQANGLSQVIELADGVQRFTICDMSILHGNNLADINTTNLQNHHIQLTANRADNVDIEIRNIHFGPCIGDAIRVLGTNPYASKNTRVHGITMRCGGHRLSPNGGSRSGISFNRGFDGFELCNFYIHGAKNSPIDCEPTGPGPMNRLDLHDGVVDNRGGVTAFAISFGGYEDANHVITPITNSRLANLRVYEGQVNIINTEDCEVVDVDIYASGQAGMAGATAPLLYIFHQNRNLRVRDVDLVRDTGSAAGPLVLIQHSTATSPLRVTIEGGVWLTKVGPGSNLAHVDLQDVDKLKWSGTQVRVEESSPSGHYAVSFRPGNNHITQVQVDDIRIESPNGRLKAGIWFAALTRNISNVQLRGIMGLSCAANGVLFDAQSSGVCDPYPILAECDFSDCTNIWSTDHNAVGAVFPIIAGNRGAICSIVGVVAPEGVVTAVQGSLYIRQNGDSTTIHSKASGNGNTGWKQLIIN